MKIGAKVHLFNAKMREAREKCNLTQRDLAKLLGVPQQYIQNIETLKNVKGSYEQIRILFENISDLLSVPFDILFPAEYLFAIQNKFLPKTRNLVLFREIDINALPLSKEMLALPGPEELIEGQIMEDGLKDDLAENLLRLPAREQQVLRLRYYKNLTLEEVSIKIGVTRERVRQIEQQAFRRLRHPSVRRKLHVYLDEY